MPVIPPPERLGQWGRRVTSPRQAWAHSNNLLKSKHRRKSRTEAMIHWANREGREPEAQQKIPWMAPEANLTSLVDLIRISPWDAMHSVLMIRH